MDMGESDVSVRVGTALDVEFCVEMGMELREIEVSLGYRGYVGVREFIKYALTYFEEITNNDRFVVLVAEREGEKVGVCVGEVQLQELFQWPPVQGALLMMVVRKGERDKRIGTRLLGALEAMMYEVGVRKIVADMYQHNLPPQWGLSKYGYGYEHVRMVRYMDLDEEKEV